MKGTEPFMRLTTWANKEDKNLPDRQAALA